MGNVIDKKMGLCHPQNHQTIGSLLKVLKEVTGNKENGLNLRNEFKE